MASILSSIFEVFSAVGEWITSAVTDLIPMFYNSTESSLTFLGVLSVVGLAFSVVFLKYSGHVDSDVNCESSLISGNS